MADGANFSVGADGKIQVSSDSNIYNKDVNNSGGSSIGMNADGTIGVIKKDTGSVIKESTNVVLNNGGSLLGLGIYNSPEEEDEVRRYLKSNVGNQLIGLGTSMTTKQFDLRGLMGAPFKFSKMDDPPDLLGVGGEYGRTYIETFLAYANIVSFTPGVAFFLPGMNSEDRERFLVDSVTTNPANENQAMSSDELNSRLDENKTGKLYDFQPASGMYFDYVNTIWRFLVRLSGLSGVSSRLARYYDAEFTSGGSGIEREVKSLFAKSDKLEDIHWNTVNKSADFNKLLYGFTGSDKQSGVEYTYSFVPFYHDGPFDYSEGLDNTVGESSYASKINQIPGQEILREIGFLTGKTYEDGTEYDKSVKNQTNSAGSLAESLMSGKTLGVKTIIPEVWKDSSSSKEVQLRFKASSVSGSPECLLLTQGRMLAHLLPFALPRHSKGNFSFGAPLLVRIFAKGMPQIDIGMVTGMQIQRDTKSMTSSGLPADLIITMTIRDMTPIVALPHNRRGVGAGSAIGFMNMIGSLTGCNVSLLDWAELNLWMNFESLTKPFTGQAIWRSFGNAMTDYAGRIKSRFLR